MNESAIKVKRLFSHSTPGLRPCSQLTSRSAWLRESRSGCAGEAGLRCRRATQRAGAPWASPPTHLIAPGLPSSTSCPKQAFGWGSWSRRLVGPSIARRRCTAKETRKPPSGGPREPELRVSGKPSQRHCSHRRCEYTVLHVSFRGCARLKPRRSI
jgi:hypothetical protein